MATTDTPQSETQNGITITDVGPNQSVTIPLPAEGGVTVLRGRNDIGKSEALKAVGALAGRKDKLSVRQDAPLGTKGRVVGGGVELSVTGSTRRKGQAEFLVLDGRLSMADLVDPGVKDPEAADAKRIKALLSLADASADARLFYNLVGGVDAMEHLLPPDALEDADMVTIAARVKRALETKARGAEGQSDHQRGKAKGLRESVGEIHLNVESDSAVLQAALEKAIGADSALKQQRETAETASRTARESRVRMELAESDYKGPTAEEAQVIHDNQHVKCSNALDRADKLREELLEAEEALEHSHSALREAGRAIEAAQDHEKLVTLCRETIESADNVPDPTDEQLTETDAHVVAAREAVEQGALIRQAEANIARAREAEIKATFHEIQALQLRESAKGTDEVLSEIVATLGCPLRVRGGRLVVDSDGREKFYGELSAGARWKLALDIGIDAVGEHGLLPIPQGAWEGLDPVNRRLIAEHVSGRRVNIITAECSESETVEAEVFASPTS